MAVLNVTEQSLSGDGIYEPFQNKSTLISAALSKVESFIRAGCHSVDIGAESTRPGAEPVAHEDELERVIPVVEAISKNFDIPISIDTTKAIVADEAIKHGARIINDVSGLKHDPNMIIVAAQHQCHTIIMHSFTPGIVEKTELGGRYVSSHVNQNEDVVQRIITDLNQQIDFAKINGLDTAKIIIDPGIGFGKTVEQNLTIMDHLHEITALPYPVLLGASRKSFIGFTTNTPVEKRLAGSIAALTVGILKGAKIIRVHDIDESVKAAILVDAILSDKKISVG